jgi:Sulfocyanin (SoxE) domain
MSPAIRFAVLGAALTTLAACAGRSQSPAASPQSKAAQNTDSAASPVLPRPASPGWVVSDSAIRTATVSLEVTRPADAPSALINGFRAGGARVIVPRGWTVKWTWRNADSSAPHSLAVMTQREKIPLEGGRPAFSNAMTRMVTAGLPAGQTDQTTFEADEAGWFWLLCGVPEHALAGEWIELQVSREARAASAVAKQRER